MINQTPSLPHHTEDQRAIGDTEYRDMRVFEAWRKYGDILSWGRGQTLALLDDSCDLAIPEWQAKLPWGPKVISAWNSVEDNADPSPIPPAYHGTTMGFPSSLNYLGRGGIAFNDHLAPVRCVRHVYIGTILNGDRVECSQMESIRKALQWVIDNREKLNITTVNLAILDGAPPKHAIPPVSDIDSLLKKLTSEGVWVSAPCGNEGSSTLISWPAISPFCVAIGASGAEHDAQKDRNEYTDLLARAEATSSSNAYAAGSSMVLREAIEKNNFDWKQFGPTLPGAMLAIFQQTGVPVKDRETGRNFTSLDLLAALDFVFANVPKTEKALPVSSPRENS